MEKFTVYLLTCGLGRYKIGYTSRTAEERAQELTYKYRRKYTVLMAVKFNGDQLDGLTIERMTQRAFRSGGRVEFDEKTQDHFNTLLNKAEAQARFLSAVKRAYSRMAGL